MAEHLASIYGTEKDRVNCPFYFKTGTCRHGDACQRLHNRPTLSPTLLFTNMYQHSNLTNTSAQQQHFEDFYEDIFEELNKYGEIETLIVCDNKTDHMIGNVYVHFEEEDQAAAALKGLQGRFYEGRVIMVEFSPVTDFREARCRQYEEDNCKRGGDCNFMHVKMVGKELRRKLFGGHRGRDFDRRGRDYYRDGSEERRARIERWNQEKEEKGMM